jgi:hypothetical protein
LSSVCTVCLLDARVLASLRPMWSLGESARARVCHDDLMTSDLAAGVFAFTWLALAMTLVPGSDTVFVIRSSLRGGWFAGVVAALGVVTGVIV